MPIKLKLLTSAVVMTLVLLGQVSAGTLFDETHYRSLVGDHRAYAVGESLTVMIYEQASAASSADTDTSKDFDVAGRVRGNYSDHGGSLVMSNNFSGGGTVSRSGNLVASISVTVTEVLPNGELKVSGGQLIQLNEEQQRIEVSGRVRPEDISVNNTVSSTRLADGRIDYVGDGLLGSRQKPGILTRVFNWLF
jgi:flagellar L-ring protein FlgH